MKAWLRNILGWGFVAFALGIVTIATSLIFQPDRIYEESFWLIIGLKILVTILTFNITYFNVLVSLKTDTTSSMSQAFNDYATLVGVVHTRKLHALVRDKIADGNASRMRIAATTLLQRVTHELDYDGVLERRNDINALVGELGALYGWSWFGRWKLRRVIYLALRGKVKYERLRYNHIMLDSNITNGEYAKMYVNERAELVLRNINMAIGSTILAILTTIFALGEVNNIFYELLSNGITIIFAIFNAYMFGNRQITKLKCIFQTRKDFLCEFIDK
jgi:hypothetical protein